MAIAKQQISIKPSLLTKQQTFNQKPFANKKTKTKTKTTW
jgi:hypothetical protein